MAWTQPTGHFTAPCRTCGETVISKYGFALQPACDKCNPITPEMAAEMQRNVDAQLIAVIGDEAAKSTKH